MKYKVFSAKMEIKFTDSASYFASSVDQEMEFASADGISGTVTLTDLQLVDKKTVFAEVVIETERKRMFPDFEAYLNLITTVVGSKAQVSVGSLKDVQDVFMRTYSDLMFIRDVQNLAILEDIDGKVYVSDPRAVQKILNVFDDEESALNYITDRLGKD